MRPCLLKTKKKKILFRLSFLWLPPCLPWSFLHYMTGCTPPHLFQYLLFLHCGIPSDLVSTVPLIGNCSGEDCNCLLKCCLKWLHFNLCLKRPVLGFMPTTRKYICSFFLSSLFLLMVVVVQQEIGSKLRFPYVAQVSLMPAILFLHSVLQ